MHVDESDALLAAAKAYTDGQVALLAKAAGVQLPKQAESIAEAVTEAAEEPAKKSKAHR